MGKYGINVPKAEDATSANAYTYVEFTNSGLSKVQISIENGHAANGIKYIIYGYKRTNGTAYIEVAETLLAAVSADEIDVDPMFSIFKIGYKSAVAATHSDKVQIDVIGRVA